MKRAFLFLIAAILVCAPLAAEQALFRNAMIGFGGGSVVDMKTADINHDGKQDVILLQWIGDTNVFSLITLPGNGDGTFRAPVKTPIGSSGLMALGDLDGDGQADVVLNRPSHVLETYRGNSDGSFTLRSTQNQANIGTGSPMVLVDVNGDGKLDLVAASYVLGEFATPLVTFLGKGDGTFAGGITQPGPYTQSMNAIAAGDFNGDGRMDVIESSSLDQRIATGKGDGSFNAPMMITSETGGRVVAGDFNGDGKLDYFSTGFPASVHLGDGTGTFTKGATYDIGESVRPVSLDFDGDGKLNLVTLGGDQVSVLHLNGDGTFTVRSYVANASALAVADFDGDHHPDVLAAIGRGLVLLHGNGDGSLAAYHKYFLGSNPAGSSAFQYDFVGIAVADFNGDGKPDVVSRNGGIIVMLNSSDGGFGPPRPLPLPPSVEAPLAFRTGDVNGDGKPDIVVAGTRLWTYIGNGDGTFSTAAATDLSTPGRLFLADMNGDGKLDAVVNDRLFPGNGDGTFAASRALPAYPSLVADFDGDGRPDFSSNSFDSYTIYRNNANGTFTTGTPVTNAIGLIATGDFNGDGKTDLVDEQYSSYIRMRLGRGDGSFTDLPPFHVSVPDFSSAVGAVTADFDGDGKLDLAFTNQVMLGNGDGTFRAIVPCVVSRPWSDLAAADVDGNGSADLLLFDNENSAVNTLLTRTVAAGTTPLSFTATSSLSTLHPGEIVTVAATASTSSNFIPSGGIRIDADGVFAGFAPFIDGSASLNWTPLTLGDHIITASYAGDDVFPARSASLTRTAVKLDSRLILDVSRPSPQQQEPITIRATIYPQQPSTIAASGGTITIRDGDAVLYSGVYSQTKLNQVNYKFPTAGTHTLTLDYSGDVMFNPGSITLLQPVSKAIAFVGLSGSPASPLIAGQSLKLQAVVSSYINPGGGTVTFHDFDRDIGTATLTASFASITIQPTAGYHSYWVTYNGSADMDPTSSTFNLDFVVEGPPCTPASNCLRRHAVH